MKRFPLASDRRPAQNFLPAMLTLAMLAGLALMGPQATASVFGRDDRVPLPKSMQHVGDRLGLFFDSTFNSVCTAFCVAPDVIGTAAHCLYRTAGQKPLQLTDLSFRLHGTSRKYAIAGAKSGAAEANVFAGSTRLNVHPPIDATRDWAFVRLEQPACSKGTFTVTSKPVDEVMKLSTSGRVFNTAFHRDLPKWQPMLNSGCLVRRSFDDADWKTIRRDFTNSDQLLLHTCDTGAASSGSPLLMEGANGPEIVGINVGTYVQSKVIMLNGEVLHRFKADDVANTGVNAQSFDKSLTAFIAADTVSSHKDISRLQELLAQRGLYMGPRDGVYGPQLRTAIMAFERASQMPPTGFASYSLLDALAGESEIVTGKIPSARTSSGQGKP
ncbi:peptidoglycan-binding protein [Hyphomicrobium sulfonivorans]|uniref:peptidoglycan-binding protein n=1 Tax=Hyphomicrobium sulfonivorans TaxID=121290 RepID=UPI001570BC1E|nr:peptidoglycan-binding protein [Hyphomicrobium sulfonivorans]MBI1650810.1 peptidoglycan-binding protein [Hyphomicrobium sulfonivorans]NSL71834.1 hypothetical protein [Hyphomicrobium sulfonivorans]